MFVLLLLFLYIPRIVEVQRRVLLPPYVDVHGHGLLGLGGVARGVVVVGIQVAEEVPRGVNEGVHGVGLAPGRAAAT